MVRNLSADADRVNERLGASQLDGLNNCFSVGGNGASLAPCLPEAWRAMLRHRRVCFETRQRRSVALQEPA